MRKIRKVFNLIIFISIGLTLFLTSMVHASNISEHTLRLPLGETEGRLKKIIESADDKEDSPSKIRELQYLDLDKDGWTTTNEDHLLLFHGLEDLPRRGGGLLAIGEYQVLDIAIALNSEAIVLVDLNKSAVKKNLEVLKIVETSESVDEILPRIFELVGKLEDKDSVEYLKAMLSEEGAHTNARVRLGWARFDDEFRRLKKMISEGKVAVVHADITKPETTKVIGDFFRAHGVRLEYAYLSNVISWRDGVDLDSKTKDEHIGALQALYAANAYGDTILIRSSGSTDPEVSIKIGLSHDEAERFAEQDKAERRAHYGDDVQILPENIERVYSGSMVQYSFEFFIQSVEAYRNRIESSFGFQFGQAKGLAVDSSSAIIALSTQKDLLRIAEEEIATDLKALMATGASRADREAFMKRLEGLVRELTADGLLLEQNSVYERLINELTEEEIFLKLSSDFHLFEEPDDDYYNYDITRYMMEKVTRLLGKRFVKLLADPCISNRLEEFISFAVSVVKAEPNIELLKLREAFRESLGTIVVYRGALLNQRELQEIKRDGFISALNRRGAWVGLRGDSELTPRDIAELEIVNLRMRMKRHTRDTFMENSCLISVSNNPRMAAYAACQYLETEEIERKISEGYKIYLFPIEMQEFDLIRHDWYIDFMSPTGGSYVDSEEEINRSDTGNEAVVQFSISPERILFRDIKELSIEDIPQYELVPQDDLDRIVKLTSDASDYIEKYFKERVPLWGKYNYAGERFAFLPILGVVSLFSMPHLERNTGEAVWIGATTDHPNQTWTAPDSPFLKRQSVFVDSRHAYDREFIIKEIGKVAIDSGKTTAEEIDALLESAKSSSHNL